MTCPKCSSPGCRVAVLVAVHFHAASRLTPELRRRAEWKIIAQKAACDARRREPS